jgi:hypothetical protein
MDAIMHMADALKEACADVIATWQAAQEPCVPKTPTAVTAAHPTMGQEWDASQAQKTEHAEDDIHTWYACSPDKASGLQAASRAMHGMLAARRSGCSPTAGHALDVQRSWLSSELSRQLSRSDAGAESSPFTIRSLSGSFGRSAGREPVVAAGWCGWADSFPRTGPLREYRPPTANQPYRSPPLKPTADLPCRRSKAVTPLQLERVERES